VKRPTEAPLELTQSARDVSVTERGQFRTCRRRWTLETIENLTPKAPTWALEFGTGIHGALEAYYESLATGDGNSLEIAVESLEDWHEEMEESQQEELGGLYSKAVEEELWDLYGLGRQMLDNYALFSADKAREDPWEVLAIEGKEPGGKIISPATFGEFGDPPYGRSAHPFIHQGRILCPIVNPTTGHCLPGRPFLSGRLDLIVRRAKRNNTLWVVDHKTTASSPSDRGLDFDDQVTGYSYLMWRLTGLIPRGTIFNYLVKQVPKEPRIISVTAKNPDGKLSTAKDQLCLAADYRKVMLERGIMRKDGTVTSEEHAECYAGLLAKGYDPYFKRFEPTRNEDEVLHFEERLYQEYRDMRHVYQHRHEGAAYPNPSTWWCPSCSVGPICQAMEDGSDVEGIIDSRYMHAPDRKAER